MLMLTQTTDCPQLFPHYNPFEGMLCSDVNRAQN
jgi:hypothetical protein